MRPLLAGVVLLLVLSGCSAPPEANDATATVDPDAPFVPPSQAGATLPRLRFAAADYEQTATYDGSFEMQGCVVIQPCDGREVRFDLTPQIPADAPVELAAAMTVASSSGCVFSDLEVVDTAIQRLSAQQEQLAANLVRQPSGTVTLVLGACGIESVTPNSPAVPVSAEVRTVVRPDVLPPYMPVTVRLAPGDRILAMGEGSADLDAMVVVPPGLDPVHLLDEPSFNVTEGMPSGDYIVVVKGGEAMLHGPNVTLVPAPLHHFLGEARDLPSGQAASWSTKVPGVPAYAALIVEMGRPGSGVDDPNVRYMSDIRLSISQAGTEIAAYEQPSCTAPGLPCQVNGFGGYSSTSMGTAYFPESLRPGEVGFEAESSMSQGVVVYELIAYVPFRE